MDDFDFDSAGMTAAALNFAESQPASAPVAVAPPASPAAVPAAPVAAAPVGEQPKAETPATPAAPVSEPVPIELKDTDWVTVTIKGETKSMPWGEAKADAQRGLVFTQNSQKVAAERAALEARQAEIAALEQRAQRVDQLENLLTNDRALTAFIQKAHPHLTLAQAQAVAAQAPGAVAAAAAATPVAPAFTPTQLDPESLVSMGALAPIIQSKISEIESEWGRRLTETEARRVAESELLIASVDAKVDARIQRLETAKEVAAIDARIESTIGTLQASHPQLKAIPQLNDLIRFEAKKMNPGSEAEMFEAIEQVAKGMVETLDAHYNQARTAEVIAKAKLTTHGVEAPSGVAPQLIKQPVPAYTGDPSKFWDDTAQLGIQFGG